MQGKMVKYAPLVRGESKQPFSFFQMEFTPVD